MIIGGTFRGTLELGAIVLDSDTWDKAFVARLDPTGAPLWAQSFGDFNSASGGVAADPGGRIAVAGGFSDRIVLGGRTHRSTGQMDAFVARLDRGGALLASQLFGDSRTYALNEDQVLKAVAVDAAGAVLSAGTYRGAVDYGGGEVVSLGKSGIFVSRLAP